MHSSATFHWFSASQSRVLIHIHETVGNLGLQFDTMMTSFKYLAVMMFNIIHIQMRVNKKNGLIPFFIKTQPKRLQQFSCNHLIRVKQTPCFWFYAEYRDYILHNLRPRLTLICQQNLVIYPIILVDSFYIVILCSIL